MKIYVDDSIQGVTVEEKRNYIIELADTHIPAGIPKAIFQNKGSLLVGTGPETYVEFLPGTDNQVVIYDSTQPSGLRTGSFTILPRVRSVTSSATVTPNADTDDMLFITAQAQALTLANPSGSPISGQKLIIRLKDNGTARAITWGAIYRAVGVTLPTTTVINKTMYIGCIYNIDATKWDVLAVSEE